ncbi:NADP-dependent oxidoreductase domain-containing protein [Lasiosphaeris hirsuta]|uniref:NADP-dependent oxidoreductase domain-containing protein n=1 Tax=Lasiosphaeris hirsuta TaxID=260670 RepID=A0AA40EBJ2_9PEZI|nr:NADP-dependent oxidoreductase domain-containing protein [Lasiosphaeris hirsuta]
MKAALANGMNFWNGGEFYGPPERNSLVVLEKYLEKYPEDADKVVISVKGAMGAKGPDGSAEGINRSISNIIKQLNGRKKLDVFECARRDPKVPMEETFAAMQEWIDKGLLGSISLSEVSASTIHAAVKITKVSFVEVELSLWCTDILTNGVAAACAQYNIPVVAYSPLGSGILTGAFKSVEDLAGTHFKDWPRFSPENFEINLQLVKQVETLAQKKGCTPAQLAISWTRNLSKRPGMPTIIPIPGATTVARVNENAIYVDLSEEEMSEIDATLAKFEVKGDRYPASIPMNT